MVLACFPLFVRPEAKEGSFYFSLPLVCRSSVERPSWGAAPQQGIKIRHVKKRRGCIANQNVSQREHHEAIDRLPRERERENARERHARTERSETNARKSTFARSPRRPQRMATDRKGGMMRGGRKRPAPSLAMGRILATALLLLAGLAAVGSGTAEATRALSVHSPRPETGRSDGARGPRAASSK